MGWFLLSERWALATGGAVIGIYWSPTMIDNARRRADAAGVELILHLGDMADLRLADPAALIVCPFRALLHVPTWSARRHLFERVAASLRPGGRFAWNAFAFDHHVAARIDGVRVVERGFAHTDHFAVGDNRVDIVLDSGATSSLWWATKIEWLGLIDVAGLELEALYGGLDRTPYDDRSGEYVFVTRRPEG
ncbi:MAG: class I SAM-dependent methyltransferase [Ilumatobacteraceae bacterium]